MYPPPLPPWAWVGPHGLAGALGVFCRHFVAVLGSILGLFAFVFSGPNCSAGYIFMKFSAANFQGFHVNFFSSFRLSKLFLVTPARKNVGL